MNLLEHYIKEIHSVEEKKVDFKETPIIIADLTINCYGRIERTKESFMDIDEWNEAKEKGYYLG